MRKTAQHWIELAEKVYAYRRDELKDADRLELAGKTEQLRAQLKAREDASKLKLGIERLEEVLRRTGGTFYPRSSLQEYVEFFVVAAIVILGIRAYIAQPFKIPTNSMWPTYHGMTSEVYKPDEAKPNLLIQAARFALLGAQHQEIISRSAGKVRLQVRKGAYEGVLVYDQVPGRSWGIFPTLKREYTLRVANDRYKIQVPAEFDFDWTIRDAFGVTREMLREAARKAPQGGNGEYVEVELPLEVKPGQRILGFDILTGDQLFVERLSYHFVQPSVGSGFVFRTREIPGIGQDEYYIKRLVGTPGDIIEIKEPALFRNGKPISGAQAFLDNAMKRPPYAGYFNAKYPGQLLQKGHVVKVPEKSYFALGDNSGNSSDGRVWGFIPYKEIVGRPLFIYYPVSRRFGLAK